MQQRTALHEVYTGPTAVAEAARTGRPVVATEQKSLTEVRAHAVKVYRDAQAAESKAAKAKAKRKKKAKKAQETQVRKQAIREARKALRNVSEKLDPPAGTLPSPDAEPKLWELSPDEFRAKATAQLWPTSSDGRWVPQAPMTIDQFLRQR